MNDYKKIKVIHSLQSTFTTDSETLNKLISQIEDPSKIDNLERFLSGSRVEDNFYYVFSALPWIKLIHPLSQEQVPNISKKEFQVPDFLVMFENHQMESIPLLIEVKGVKKERSYLSLQKIQIENLLNYAKVLNLPLLFAIYWRKIQRWTITSTDIFEKKTTNYKVTLEAAILNDLSVIFADFTFIFPSGMQRMREFDIDSNNEKHPKHKDFGVMTGEWITWDTKTVFEVDTNESNLIRSFVSMKNLKVERDKSITRTLDISNTQYLPKFSYLILRLLNLLNEKLDEEYCSYAAQIIYNLFEKKTEIKKLYLLPNKKTPMHDLIMSKAFKDSDMLDTYHLKKR